MVATVSKAFASVSTMAVGDSVMVGGTPVSITVFISSFLQADKKQPIATANHNMLNIFFMIF
jgi:hypothetical protein